MTYISRVSFSRRFLFILVLCHLFRLFVDFLALMFATEGTECWYVIRVCSLFGLVYFPRGYGSILWDKPEILGFLDFYCSLGICFFCLCSLCGGNSLYTRRLSSSLIYEQDLT